MSKHRTAGLRSVPTLVVSSVVVAFLLASVIIPVPAVRAGVAGAIVVVGNGPELATIEALARAFERRHLGAVVDIQWDPLSDPIKVLTSGDAQMAVSGAFPPNLSGRTIAWDGIAVVVYSGSPMKEVTTAQLTAIFSGKVRRWGTLSGHDLEIQLIDRPQNQPIRQSFEESLGIEGQIPGSARRIRSDQRTMSTVAGSLRAVAYTSLRPALDAVAYGVDITLLTVDGIEAAEATVKDGRYKLRRPVQLIYDRGGSPVSEAFAVFALSEEGQRIISERFTPLWRP